MLDPLYCNTCNKGNLNGGQVALCRRTYCDARNTAKKIDESIKREMWKREREAESMHQPCPIDQYDQWMP